MKPPEEIQELCRAFREGLEAVLADNLFGAVLYGAVAFPKPGPTGDIDFHVIPRETPTEEERAGLYELHETLARRFLRNEVEGLFRFSCKHIEESGP